jgi:tol-pal system protein YbgF
MISRIALAASGLGLAFMLAHPAHAQDQQRMDQLLSRMDRMERDIGALSRQVYRNGSAPAGAPAQGGASAAPPSGNAYDILDSRLTQLEGSLNQLTDSVETLNHQNSELKDRLDKMSKDVDLRLSDLEKGGGKGTSLAPADLGNQAGASRGSNEPGPAPKDSVLGTLNQKDLQGKGSPAAQQQASTTPADQGAVRLPDGSPQQQYDYALSLLSKSNYTGASSAFQQFIDKNPTGPLTSAARYWLGESYYVRKDYSSAARVFLEGYQKDPKGQKAPDTLLKLGMSLTSLDKKKEACTTYDKLAKDYPDASANIKRVLPRERQRAGCPGA